MLGSRSSELDEEFRGFVLGSQARLLRFAELLRGDRHVAEDLTRQNGDLCYGNADMSTRSANRSILSLSCGTAPGELTTAGPTELGPGWPVFQPTPSKVGEWLAIGILRGTAAAVEVTANGQTAEASVHPLATTTGEAAGAYAV